jgi:hypothetical protein
MVRVPMSVCSVLLYLELYRRLTKEMPPKRKAADAAPADKATKKTAPAKAPKSSGGAKKVSIEACKS